MLYKIHKSITFLNYVHELLIGTKIIFRELQLKLKIYVLLFHISIVTELDNFAKFFVRNYRNVFLFSIFQYILFWGKAVQLRSTGADLLRKRYLKLSIFIKKISTVTTYYKLSINHSNSSLDQKYEETKRSSSLEF